MPFLKCAFFATMTKRYQKPNFDKILKTLVKRDLEDEEVEKSNRELLKKAGFKIYPPKKVIRIDTGKVIGVKNVLKIICKEIAEDHRFISIEGRSGTGKGSTAEGLRKNLNAIKISLGEIFRFLTHISKGNVEIDFEEVSRNLEYKYNGQRLHLYHAGENVSEKLFIELKSPELEKHIPKVADKTQKIVIKFVDRELSKLRKVDKQIVIEGRGFALDFLPSDVRVKLTAHPKIRARRRHRQKYDHRSPV